MKCIRCQQNPVSETFKMCDACMYEMTHCKNCGNLVKPGAPRSAKRPWCPSCWQELWEATKPHDARVRTTKQGFTFAVCDKCHWTYGGMKLSHRELEVECLLHNLGFSGRSDSG